MESAVGKRDLSFLILHDRNHCPTVINLSTEDPAKPLPQVLRW